MLRYFTAPRVSANFQRATYHSSTASLVQLPKFSKPIDEKSFISAQDLQSKLQSKHKPVILDTRHPDIYKDGHIESALNVQEIFTFLSTSTPEGLTELKKFFTEKFESAGITDDVPVVVYEQSLVGGYGQSCRGYFLLKYLGHPEVSVLHGGIDGWLSSKFPLTTEVRKVEKRGKLSGKVDSSIFANRDEMLEVLKSKSDKSVILDCRDRDEWEGLSSSPYGRNFTPAKGRIPGATWVEWYDVLKKSDGVHVLETEEDILHLMGENGVTPEKDVYLYCFKGSCASTVFMALRQAGFGKVKNYFAGWQEWSRIPGSPIDSSVNKHYD